MASLQGKCLVASSRLLDPNFFRTVVFLIQHDADGALGVVLTRPMSNTVGSLWEQVCGEPCDNGERVHWGGPVNGPVLMLHTDVAASQDEILPGLYLAADREQLERVLHEDEHRYRVFVGYSGWGPGQLESELADGSWLVAPGSLETVFSESEELWEELMEQIGGAALAPLLGSIPVPQDPSWN